MKRLSVLALVLLRVYSSFGQEQVKWSFFAKKVKDKTFEIRAIANIADGWFIYAQNQPQGSVSQPTEFTFAKNPLLRFATNVPSEEGVVIRKRYPTLGYVANTYKEEVSFVQTVTVTADIKTNIQGRIKFQACNDQMCLPPEDAKFSLQLQ